MNKIAIVFVLVATLVAVLMSASFVFAQGPAPVSGQNQAGGYGSGMNGAGLMSSNGVTAVGEEILHDAMIEVYAEELGISVDDLNARLDAGETLAQIAYAQGLTTDEFTALMAEARSQAIEQAVASGMLTQVQANWMQQRSTGTMGARGAGRVVRVNSADCTYYPQTNP